jgi:hypothetical protein
MNGKYEYRNLTFNLSALERCTIFVSKDHWIGVFRPQSSKRLTYPAIASTTNDTDHIRIDVSRFHKQKTRRTNGQIIPLEVFLNSNIGIVEQTLSILHLLIREK